MTLADRIRAQLSTWVSEHDTNACNGPCPVTSGIVAMRDVLCLHSPDLRTHMCRACRELDPCRTVIAIAAPLGIAEAP